MDASRTRPLGRPDLDSLDVGNGALDGVSDEERKSAASLWALIGGPLVTGSDLTRLTPSGLALLTHGGFLAVHRAAGDRTAVESAIRAARECGADEIILAMPWQQEPRIQFVCDQLRASPLPVRLLPVLPLPELLLPELLLPELLLPELLLPELLLPELLLPDLLLPEPARAAAARAAAGMCGDTSG